MTKDLQTTAANLFSPMQRDGCHAPADLQKRAFVKWMSSGRPAGYSDLAARMNHDTPMHADVDYPYHRIADALVQKLRKASLIERKGKLWKLTDDGQAMLEYLAETV